MNQHRRVRGARARPGKHWQKAQFIIYVCMYNVHTYVHLILNEQRRNEEKDML